MRGNQQRTAVKAPFEMAMGELSRLVEGGAPGLASKRKAVKEPDRDAGEAVSPSPAEIAEEVAEPPCFSEIRAEFFTADSAGRARTAATMWLSDFTIHGPLQIQSIRTAPRQDEFVAVVTYRSWEPGVASDLLAPPKQTGAESRMASG